MAKAQDCKQKNTKLCKNKAQTRHAVIFTAFCGPKQVTSKNPKIKG